MASVRGSYPIKGTNNTRESLESSLSFLSFDMGRLSIPSNGCLHNILDRCFAKIRGFFHLADTSNLLAEPSSLERVLSCIFDATSLPFVTETTDRIAAGLDDHEKACLFVQAVAGMVLFLRRLAAAGVAVSEPILARELQLFAESEQRRALLETVATSPLLRSCYTKAVLVDFLEEAIDDPTTENLLPETTMKNDFPSDPEAWVNDRPCKNMGLPWGFTIMALN
ncbi:hypothetical protein VTJ83DRAFT_3638 [Remersonia thermophila]|uniref:Uncharacterized protein n=1 Tax=Remersonia thermophila TaxID=72144 RepID=A0ABR4DEM3_9PEZI